MRKIGIIDFIRNCNDPETIRQAATREHRYASPKTIRRRARVANRRLAELKEVAMRERPNVSHETLFRRLVVPPVIAPFCKNFSPSRRKVCGKDAPKKTPNAWPKVKGSAQ